MKTSTYSKFVTIAQQAIILLSFVVMTTFYSASAQTAVTCDQLVGWAKKGKAADASNISTAIAADASLINCQGNHGYTALNTAAKKGLLNIVEILISESANTEIADNMKERTPLFWAAARLNTAVVKHLIDNGADPDHEDKAGNVVLNILLRKNDPAQIQSGAEIFILLINGDADIDASNMLSKKVFKYVAEKNNVGVLRTLIAREGDLERPYEDQPTFLLYAAKNKDATLVSHAIEENGKVNATNSMGETPLMIAINNDNQDVFDTLIEASSIDVNVANTKKETALIIAAKKGNAYFVEELLDKVSTNSLNLPDDDGNTALIIAVKKGNLEIVKKLLGQVGISVRHKNNAQKSAMDEALALLQEDKRRDIATALLFADALAPAGGAYNTLKYAQAENNDDSELAMVLAKKILSPKPPAVNVSFEYDGVTHKSILHYAAYEGNVPLVVALVKDKAPEIEDDNGDTPLYIAIRRGHADVETALTSTILPAYENTMRWALIESNNTLRDTLELGLSVNIAYNGYKSILHYAAYEGNVPLVVALVKDKAPEIEDDNGDTPLYIAIRRGHADVETALTSTILPAYENTMRWALIESNNTLRDTLELGLSVNIAYNDYETILHYAAYEGNASLVVALVKDKAPEIKDDNGDTPLYIAIRRKHTTIEILFTSTILPAYENTMRWALIESDNTLRNTLELKGGVNIAYLTHKNILLWVVDGDNPWNNPPVSAVIGKTPIDDAVALIGALRADFATDTDKNGDGNIAHYSSIAQKLDKRIQDAFGTDVLKTLRWALENRDNDLRDRVDEQKDVSVSYKGRNSILLYFSRPHDVTVELVEALIADGAELDTISSRYRMPALTWRANYSATFPGNGAFHALLEEGADRNVVGLYDWTTLMFITSRARYDLAKLLLSGTGKAIVDAEDRNGYTALLSAARTTFPEPTDETLKETVKVLIDKGADISHEANDGNTALILAANNGYSKVVEALLKSEKGSNTKSSLGFCYHRNNSNKSALDYANSKRSNSANHEKVYVKLTMYCPEAPRMGRSPSSSGHGEQEELHMDLPPMPVLTL